jgi:hypothetical protein
MSGGPNRAERRRQKAQQRAAAKATVRQPLYSVHVARPRLPPHTPRVQNAIREWIACYRIVRCGGCNHIFDSILDHVFDRPRVPEAFVLALPCLDHAADSFSVAFCEACAEQSDDALVTAAEPAMRAAWGADFFRLPVHAVHAEGGTA